MIFPENQGILAESYHLENTVKTEVGSFTRNNETQDKDQLLTLLVPLHR